MRLDVESFEDFHQYYSGRFVKGRGEAETFLVHGDAGNRTIAMDRYVHGRLDDRVQIAWKDLPSRIFFGLPRLGMVVYNNELLFLYYHTTRNGGRGYDRNRIRHHSHNRWLLHGAGLPVWDRQLLTHPVFVHLSVLHNHTPWAKAMDGMFAEVPPAPAYALSFNFGVYLGSGDHPVLVYKTDEIGHLTGPTKVVLKTAYAEHDSMLRRIAPLGVEITT